MQIAKEKGICINILCDENIKLLINPLLMEQALTNLINNAIEYSHNDGKITIEVLEFDQDITISVQDFGCGIEEQHLDRIFEQFYRVDKSRSRNSGGAGLGLSIVKHIIQAHNANIEVKSTPKVGTCFSVKFKKNI